jgi:predicted NBD/HSP70 family sugar kinase
MLYEFLKNQSIQNLPLKLIYEYIYRNGSVSQSDIIKYTNLNRSKVARSLKDLLEKNYIREMGQGDSEGGRPPILYQINPTSSYIIGVQMTRTETQIFLFDLMLNRLDEKTIMMTSMLTPRMVIEEIVHTIKRFLDIHHLTTEDLLGIGMGAIGPLDCAKGIILNSEPFLTHGWENIPIVDEIKRHFPVMVKFDNAANNIVRGEYQDHQDYENILNVTVGWTWGCGVIANRQLLTVDSCDISGYGHMVIDINGKPCFCGRKGCMTAYTSLYAILEQIKERSPLFYCEKLKNTAPLEQIQHMVSQQDPNTHEVILESAQYIGSGVANLAAVYHPQLILVNGPLINNYPGYYDEIILATSLQIGPKNIQFRQGDVKRETGVKGGAIQILDSLLKDSF